MIEVRWAPLARRDIARITAHHLRDNPDFAEVIGRRIIAATSILREHPLAGAVAFDGKRRKWRVSGTRYNLFYRAHANHVRVLRVLHDAQDQIAN